MAETPEAFERAILAHLGKVDYDERALVRELSHTFHELEKAESQARYEALSGKDSILNYEDDERAEICKQTYLDNKRYTELIEQANKLGTDLGLSWDLSYHKDPDRPVRRKLRSNTGKNVKGEKEPDPNDYPPALDSYVIARGYGE